MVTMTRINNEKALSAQTRQFCSPFVVGDNDPFALETTTVTRTFPLSEKRYNPMEGPSLPGQQYHNKKSTSTFDSIRKVPPLPR